MLKSKTLLLLALVLAIKIGYAAPALDGNFFVEKSSKAVSFLNDEYKKYTGRYAIQGADFEYANVFLEDGKLYGQAEGQDRVEMIPQQEKGLFSVPSLNVTVRFTTDDQNKVSGVTIMTNEGMLRGEKVE